MNPVLRRELLVRWRGHAMWLMLAVLAVLALVAYGSYSSQLSNWGGVSSNPLAQMERIGRKLFENLMMLQALGWFLLAPALTVTAISGERERGLLESLQLSRLSLWNIVLGKLGSALFFALLLIFGVLPLLALCFVMGGVSPLEMAAGTFVNIVTVLFGECAGLYLSAVNRRSSGAIIATLVFMGVWFFGTLACFLVGDTAWRNFSHWANPAYKVFLGVGLLNPLFLMTWVATTNSRTPSLNMIAPDWMIGSGFLILISFFLLFLTVRALRRRDEEMEIAPAPKRNAKDAGAPAENRAAEYSAEIRRTHWYLLSPKLTSRLNPLLRRELHARFRVPLPRGLWRFWAALGAMALLVGYVIVVRDTVHDREFRSLWMATMILGATILGLVAAVLGGISLARERETGTWEMLRLSFIAPGEVLRAKFIAIVVACLGYSVLVWPAFILGMWPNFRSLFNSRIAAWDKIPPAHIYAALAIASLSIASSAAFGLLVSSRCRKVATAVSWTVGILFGVFGALPLMMSIVGRYEWERALKWWHPLAAMGELTSWRRDNEFAVVTTGLWTGILLFLLFLLFAELRRDLGSRERR